MPSKFYSEHFKNLCQEGGGRNRIGRREKWPKQSWEEGEIGGKSREEGEKEKLTFREEEEIGSKSREEGDIGSESREKGDLPPCSTPLKKRGQTHCASQSTGKLKICTSVK